MIRLSIDANIAHSLLGVFQTVDKKADFCSFYITTQDLSVLFDWPMQHTRHENFVSFFWMLAWTPNVKVQKDLTPQKWGL